MKDEPHSTGVCKRKLSERDVRVLTWIVSKKHETTAARLTTELNVHLISCFHQNCSPGALQGQYTWTSCYSQTFSHSCQCQFQCCLQWKWTMWNMYCSLSPPSLSVPYLGKLRCGEATKKLTTRTVACPEWSMGVDQWRFELQYHCTHYRPNTWAKDYRTILEDHVHSMVKALYPEGGAMYQDDAASKHTARLVTECF